MMRIVKKTAAALQVPQRLVERPVIAWATIYHRLRVDAGGPGLRGETWGNRR